MDRSHVIFKSVWKDAPRTPTTTATRNGLAPYSEPQLPSPPTKRNAATRLPSPVSPRCASSCAQGLGEELRGKGTLAQEDWMFTGRDPTIQCTQDDGLADTMRHVEFFTCQSGVRTGEVGRQGVPSAENCTPRAMARGRDAALCGYRAGCAGREPSPQCPTKVAQEPSSLWVSMTQAAARRSACCALAALQWASASRR